MHSRILLIVAFVMLCMPPRSLYAETDKNAELFYALESYALKADTPYKKALRYFLDIAYSFTCSTRHEQPVPQHVVLADKEFYSTAEGADSWSNFTFSIIKSLYKGENNRVLVRPLDGKVYDYQTPERFFKAATYLGADTSKAPRFMLLDTLTKYKNGGSAEERALTIVVALSSVIVDSVDREAGKMVAAKYDLVAKNRELCEQKYRQGFRSRNIIEYFATATVQNLIAKEPFGLLSPPSSWELILLSKPIAGVSTHTIGKAANDSNAIYLICPLAGVDRFNETFTGYAGVSIFSAIPFAPYPFKKTFAGFEAHVADKVLIGYGWNIDDPAGQKLFFTLPLVGGWFTSQ